MLDGQAKVGTGAVAPLDLRETPQLNQQKKVDLQELNKQNYIQFDGGTGNTYVNPPTQTVQAPQPGTPVRT